MKKIRYYYSSMSKQVFLALLMLFVLARFVLFLEVIIFDINGYAKEYNVFASVLLYLGYFLPLLFFFTGYRFFYTLYDEEKIIYHNSLLKKETSLSFGSVERAILDRKGIHLFCSGRSKSALSIPFFRFGVISPAGADDFYKLLKQKNIPLEKRFTILPGHEPSRKWKALVYSCLALFSLALLTQTLALVVSILKKHG
ncbi:MAG: hypothetical protein Q3993_03325 [Filifactor alocis]|nr:hypothetical protein [Filifactor alocis]